MFHFIPYVAKNDFHEQFFPGAGLSFSNSKNLFPELVHSLDDIPVSETKSFIFLLPLPRETIQFDEHIFPMGWNHQLAWH